jgi:hypothetical protein
MLKLALKGFKTEGDMVPGVDLSKARPAEYVFDKNVQKFISETKHAPKASAKDAGAQKSHAA